MPTKQEREQQAQIIMKLFDLWHLTNKQRALALGLSVNTETSINRYKNGHALPSSRDIQDRVRYLLAIHQFLRRAYAYNKELAYKWITTPNTDFHSKTPFEVINEEGYLGLVKIKNYLELNQY